MDLVKCLIYLKESDWDRATQIVKDDIGLGNGTSTTMLYCSKKKHPTENKWCFRVYDDLSGETINKLPAGIEVDKLSDDWFITEDFDE